MAQAQILIVEDTHSVAEQMQILLESLGYTVPAIVSSGEEAIEKAAATRPDLILMDIHMPKMKGTEAAEIIRRNEHESHHTPIIALTADAVPATRNQIADSGMDGYLLKPINEPQMWSVIKNVFSHT